MGIMNNIVNDVANFFPMRIRIKIYEKYGIKIQSGGQIRKYCFFESNRIEIGENSFINSKCNFITGAGNEKIVIGKDVQIGTGCSFICTDHKIGKGNNPRAGEANYGSIIIGDGCWIGANVTVLKDVRIGKGVVIGAGSLVTKNLEDNSLYYGVPAQKVRNLD